jgi:hypothetical protein
LKSRSGSPPRVREISLMYSDSECCSHRPAGGLMGIIARQRATGPWLHPSSVLGHSSFGFRHL